MVSCLYKATILSNKMFIIFAEIFRGTLSNTFGMIESLNYNHGHNILRPFHTLPIFFLPQVKQSVITSNKHGIHKLPYKLPNILRRRILGNQEITPQFQIIVPPLINPRIPTPLIWDPALINFQDFVLQIFPKLLKWIARNKEPQKQRVDDMEQEEQQDEDINAFDFLNNFQC